MKDSISYIAGADSLIQDSLRQHILSSDSLESRVDSLSSIHLQSHTARDEASRHDGKSLPFNIEQVDSIFVLLLLCFLFFAHIYNGGISFIKENISLLISPAKRIFRQTTAREVVYGYFLLFQAVVLISICVYDAFVEYDSYSGSNSHLITISFIILIGVFFGIKDFIYKIIGYVFDQPKLMNTWRRMAVVSIEILGILYFIPTLLLIYSNYYHAEILVFMLILFLIVQIMLFYQIIIFFVNQKFNFLYLIAYLCTFEILPYIFLSVGLIYLYRTDVFNTLWL